MVERCSTNHANIQCSSRANDNFGRVLGHASSVFHGLPGRASDVFGGLPGRANSMFGGLPGRASSTIFGDNGFGDNGIILQRQLLVHLPRAISHINTMAGTRAILRLQSSKTVGFVGLVGLWGLELV